ncbi:hypothetical protein CGSSp11BS70_01227 [Streptococcus pneumoniae SP11-BS70]|nr:hypothetical protein CGSSp11BS70_01227 [Streptococcus pneumoniae SP11-BS70]
MKKDYMAVVLMIQIHNNTLRKSNSNHVSFTLPYLSTACG